MGTSVKRSTLLKQIVDRAEGYDIPGEIVDGMNFREVRDKVAEVADSIRKESHPAFLGSAHVSIQGPLHVRSGKLPDQGGTGKISA